MTGRVLVDAGPLVAILYHRDPHHSVCVDQLHQIRRPLLTCWPVITEAAWLLRRRPEAVQRLLRGFETDGLRLLHLDETALPWMAAFVERYRNLRAQVADAALVYLAEREGIDTVFTLDRRDFSVYRMRNNIRLRLLPLVH